jgi:branched-chain amino acid transport system permease protein
MIAQQVINAVSLGGVYALLALGLAIVFSIIGLINFAHGELMTIAGYSLLAALVFGFPFPVAAVVAIGCAAIAAVLMERIAFRPMRGADVTSLLLTSFAVSSLLKVLFQNGVSARGQAVTMPQWMTGAFSIGDFTIGVGPTISIIVSLLALVVLQLFLYRTAAGTAMRAAAEDFDVVRLMGIPAGRIIATAFLLSGILAGLAAMLWVAQRSRGRRVGQPSGGRRRRLSAGRDRGVSSSDIAAGSRALSRRNRALRRYRRIAHQATRIDPGHTYPAQLRCVDNKAYTDLFPPSPDYPERKMALQALACPPVKGCRPLA